MKFKCSIPFFAIILLSVSVISGIFCTHRYVSQQQRQGLRQGEQKRGSEVEIIYEYNGNETLTQMGSDHEVKNGDIDAIASRTQHESESESESHPDPNLLNPSGQINVINETHTDSDVTDSKSTQNSTDLTPLQLLARETLSLGNSTMSYSNPTHAPPNTLGAFVHLGKTGGSTLSQLLRNGCHSFTPKPCKDPDRRVRHTKFGNNESPISKLTTYYHVPDFHNRRLSTYAPHYRFFLFTVRDPLDRTISSYLFNHPKNVVLWQYQAFRKTNGYHMKMKELGSDEEVYKFQEEKMKEKYASDIVLYNCFPTLQSYADLLDDIEKFDYGENGNINTTCANAAKMTMHLNPGDCLSRILPGVTFSMGHIMYDYNMIAYLLASVDLTNKTILVTRTGHLSKDWVSANQHLDPYSPSSYHGTTNTQRNSSTVHYAVTKELNKEGRKKLCMALKREYQIYLSLLVHAENLSAEEVAESVEYAKKKCPWLDLSLPPSQEEGKNKDELGQGRKMDMMNTLYERQGHDLCSDHDDGDNDAGH